MTARTNTTATGKAATATRKATTPAARARRLRAELEELEQAVTARRTLVEAYLSQADALAAAVADAPGELAADLAGVRALVGTCWPDATGAVVHVTGADRGLGPILPVPMAGGK